MRNSIECNVDFAISVMEVMEGFEGEEQDFNGSTKVKWKPV